MSTVSSSVEDTPAEPGAAADRSASAKLLERIQPGLEEIPGSSGESGSDTNRDGSRNDERKRRGLPIWLFLVVFVLFSVALAWQVGEVRRLESTVARLEGEIDTARALVGAHRAHLSKIQSGVRDLTDRLAGLGRLVEAGPVLEDDDGSISASEGFRDRGGPSLRQDGSGQAVAPIPARLSSSESSSESAEKSGS